jgi:hypothetical protein
VKTAKLIFNPDPWLRPDFGRRRGPIDPVVMGEVTKDVWQQVFWQTEITVRQSISPIANQTKDHLAIPLPFLLRW